jgi:hypothetical protein
VSILPSQVYFGIFIFTKKNTPFLLHRTSAWGGYPARCWGDSRAWTTLYTAHTLRECSIVAHSMNHNNFTHEDVSLVNTKQDELGYV